MGCGNVEGRKTTDVVEVMVMLRSGRGASSELLGGGGDDVVGQMLEG